MKPALRGLLPRPTARLRLTALYGALFLVAGIVLLVVTYLLVARALPGRSILGPGSHEYRGEDGVIRLDLDSAFVGTLDAEAERQRAVALHELVVQSGIALAATTVVAGVLGWLMAGRVLRPLRGIADAVHRMSADNLHERVARHRRDDEFADLTETVNAMLARLQAGFHAQRRFAANASHELRTPLTVQRSAVEVALADPAPTIESLRRMALRVQASTRQQERLIDSLLTLSTARHTIAEPVPVDLAEATRAALGSLPDSPEVRVASDLGPAWTSGDPDLLERLAANLAENAIRHNHPGGWARVRTFGTPGAAVLEVSNSGPRISPGATPLLFEPFRRQPHSPAATPGFGLGLAIVAAIIDSHRGSLSAEPLTGGGLRIRAELPSSATGRGRQERPP
ncbi:sensor histidine kinase [Amycolatopsis anabasis]|uniref:sensor histidine kinase n=1 Tax=Amycolatopsis anabasis TaxID=1840409 RepID=UPI00131CCDAF|nr:HAMP domain-containing sensor histidine kinase [Amycolatopsis anabasis]